MSGATESAPTGEPGPEVIRPPTEDKQWTWKALAIGVIAILFSVNIFSDNLALTKTQFCNAIVEPMPVGAARAAACPPKIGARPQNFFCHIPLISWHPKCTVTKLTNTIEWQNVTSALRLYDEAIDHIISEHRKGTAKTMYECNRLADEFVEFLNPNNLTHSSSEDLLYRQAVQFHMTVNDRFMQYIKITGEAERAVDVMLRSLNSSSVTLDWTRRTLANYQSGAEALLKHDRLSRPPMDIMLDAVYFQYYQTIGVSANNLLYIYRESDRADELLNTTKTLLGKIQTNIENDKRRAKDVSKTQRGAVKSILSGIPLGIKSAEMQVKKMWQVCQADFSTTHKRAANGVIERLIEMKNRAIEIETPHRWVSDDQRVTDSPIWNFKSNIRHWATLLDNELQHLSGVMSKMEAARDHANDASMRVLEAIKLRYWSRQLNNYKDVWQKTSAQAALEASRVRTYKKRF